jgi:hypothetical protein
MKKIVKILAWVLTGLALLYLGFMLLSRIMYNYAWFHGDYPGPKSLTNVHEKQIKQVDWLLLHGASLDARMWQDIVHHCPNQRVLAVSLGRHNLGSKLAEPGLESARDIVKVLQRVEVKKGIIGHSSAAVWLANAYAECPTCFAKLQIYLLAPNFCYLQVNALDKAMLDWLPSLSWTGPHIQSCQHSANYAQCKRNYLYGRLFNVNSTHYYTKLLGLCTPMTTQHIQQFVGELGAQVHYLLVNNDPLIDNIKLQNFLASLGQKVQTLPELSHHEASYEAAAIMRCVEKG